MRQLEDRDLPTAPAETVQGEIVDPKAEVDALKAKVDEVIADLDKANAAYHAKHGGSDK